MYKHVFNPLQIRYIIFIHNSNSVRFFYIRETIYIFPRMCNPLGFLRCTSLSTSIRKKNTRQRNVNGRLKRVACKKKNIFSTTGQSSTVYQTTIHHLFSRIMLPKSHKSIKSPTICIYIYMFGISFQKRCSFCTYLLSLQQAAYLSKHTYFINKPTAAVPHIQYIVFT